MQPSANLQNYTVRDVSIQFTYIKRLIPVHRKAESLTRVKI